MNIDQLKALQLDIIKKNKTCNKISTICVLSTLLITTIILLYNSSEIRIIIVIFIFELVFLLIIIGIIKNIINGKDIKLFYKNFKSVFVLNALKKNFDNIVYNPLTGFDINFVNSIGLFNTGDRFYSNDFVSGKYKNINFEQSDIHIEEKRETKDRDGNKEIEWVTIFMGRLMIFDFNKNFKTNIQISNNCCYIDKLPWEKSFSRVKTEDIEFNKNFCVYAENEHDAFYILTPAFMEKIKKINKSLNCGLMFCFVNNKLHIAVNNNEDCFEYNVFKIIDENEIEKDIIKDMKLITNFVNELDLDNRLFKK